jgi:hypothetical protein
MEWHKPIGTGRVGCRSAEIANCRGQRDGHFYHDHHGRIHLLSIYSRERHNYILRGTP